MTTNLLCVGRGRASIRLLQTPGTLWVLRPDGHTFVGSDETAMNRG
ncbi:MAG: hypothetical protein HYX54_08010 [Chloroflexi bacterium]|nr:hypothetical protein [Chloroflexota bacterium]